MLLLLRGDGAGFVATAGRARQWVAPADKDMGGVALGHDDLVTQLQGDWFERQAASTLARLSSLSYGAADPEWAGVGDKQRPGGEPAAQHLPAREVPLQHRGERLVAGAVRLRMGALVATAPAAARCGCIAHRVDVCRA